MRKALTYTFIILIIMGFLSSFFRKSDHIGEVKKHLNQQNWDVYIGYLDGKIASVYLDLGFGNIAPIQNFSTQYRLTLDMLNPRSDGLISIDESSILYGIEDEVLKLLESKKEILYVGRVASNGKYTLYFYAEDRFNLNTIIKNIANKYSQYSFMLDSAEDPEWLTYLEFIYPTPEKYQIMQNSKVVNSLQDKGDVPNIPRKVSHWLFFKSEQQRALFLSEINKESFSSLSQDYNTDFGEFPYRLVIGRNDKTDINSVNEYVLYLWNLAKKYDGDYDGWETSVISE